MNDILWLFCERRTSADTWDASWEEVDEAKGLFLSYKGKIGVIFCEGSLEFLYAAIALCKEREGISCLYMNSGTRNRREMHGKHAWWDTPVHMKE
jgi:hypothetical protein